MVVEVSQASSPAASPVYEVFISYSHQMDVAFASSLQRGLEKFAKPWNRIRAVRVFRDDASLSANPDLWSSIETALSQSRWLLVLASPEASGSSWVDREIRWWLANRSLSRVLTVVTGGEFQTDDATGQFKSEGSTAVPPALSEALKGAPRWVDARWSRSLDTIPTEHELLRDAVADVASAVHGKPKEELYSDAAREHRRARRVTRSAIVALATLLVVAIVGAGIAITERNHAVEQSRISLARQLAVTSGAELTTHLDIANLLAVQAYRADPNPQSRAALLHAATANGNLVRFISFDGEISVMEGSGDGRVVVVGLKDGRVLRAPPNATPELVATLPGEVTTIAVSDDGAVVSAVGGHEAMAWRAGSPLVRFEAANGQWPDVVAVTPSGHTVIVHRAEDRYEGKSSISVYDMPTGAVRLEDPDPHPAMRSAPTIMNAGGEDEILLLDTGYGVWERRRISDWSLTEGSKAGFGVHNYAVGVSSSGNWFSYTNADSTIPIWSTSGPTDYWSPALTAEAPLVSPTALAISPDGSQAAVADSGVIYVAPTAGEGTARGETVSLTGSGNPITNGVRFLGDSQHLISATGNSVAVWNIDQTDRITTRIDVPIEADCGACDVPAVDLTPESRDIAVAGGTGVALNLNSPTNTNTFRRGSGHRPVPVWRSDGTVFGVAGAFSDTAEAQLPAQARALQVPDEATVVAAGAAADGVSAIVVDSAGRVHVFNIDSGQVLGTIAGPPLRNPGGRGLYGAAVNSASDLVALLDGEDTGEQLTVVEARTGLIVGSIPGGDIRYVSYAGHRLLVQRADGGLEVWDERGTTKDRVITGDSSYAAPVGNDRGTIAARPRWDSTIVLVDLVSGTILDTIPAGSRFGRKTGVGFDSGGAVLVTATEAAHPPDGPPLSGFLEVRELSDEALIRTACATAGRDLTEQDWEDYVGVEAPDDLACTTPVDATQSTSAAGSTTVPATSPAEAAGVGFNGKYAVHSVRTASNFPSDPVGAALDATWSVVSACADGNCDASVQSTSGLEIVLTSTGGRYQATKTSTSPASTPTLVPNLANKLRSRLE